MAEARLQFHERAPESNITFITVHVLISKFKSTAERLQKHNEIVKRKQQGAILNEEEQVLVNCLRNVMTFVDNEVKASINLLKEVSDTHRFTPPQTSGDHHQEFSRKLEIAHETIKQSLEFATQRVNVIDTLLSNAFQNNDRTDILDLHTKVHREVCQPVMKIVLYLEALRKINEEAGINNTSETDCGAIFKDWAQCNIQFGLTEITLSVHALEVDWPDEEWLPDFQNLLDTVDQLKSVDWFHELVKAVARGNKLSLRRFDEQLRDYQVRLRSVLPTFERLMGTLTGYNFDN